MSISRVAAILVILACLLAVPLSAEEEGPKLLDAERYWTPYIDLDHGGPRTVLAEIYVPERNVTFSIEIDPATRKPRRLVTASLGEPFLRQFCRETGQEGLPMNPPPTAIRVPEKLVDRMVELAKRAEELGKKQMELDRDKATLAKDCEVAKLLTD